MKGGLGIWCALASLLAGVLRADADTPIVADLSEHLIAVTTGFTGADLLLFGAVNQTGDIALVVRGPDESVTLRRKTRMVGVWFNGTGVTFTKVPGFYAVAGTESLMEHTPPTVLRRHQVGVDHLKLELVDPDRVDQPVTYRQALVGKMQELGLFPAAVEPITVLADRLFRATVRFPANVPTGDYRVEVLFIRDGEVISAQSTPLTVSKIGFGADVFDFANRQGGAYGVIAVIVAASAGWIASLVFRKA
ncbi:MAG: hypothetical protein EXQ94_13520 [Alphaproteobacteria bacterium]|nr:hypothetical protein [Alphaproteobacteria bacterium]